MRHLFERIGDYMPHKEEIHLPSCYRKKSLYERMAREFRERGKSENDIICYDYFIRLWKIHLPEFIISKESEFVKCRDCTELEEMRAKATTDHGRQRVDSLLRAHLGKVEMERKRFHYNRERAEREPEEILTIIIDGMDQNKTNLPHLHKEDKSTSNLFRLRTHITGAIVHTGVTGGKVPFVYVDVNHIPHDSNLTMNVLLEILKEVEKHLARVLYLQLDNCFRENKKQISSVTYAVVVQLNIFEEVYVSFLPVGHTHENVDQMFSKFHLVYKYQMPTPWMT
ncbi:uncharacterized protein [Ptychodera flava]|uniref:uncharacterized protein n=1 Tax=Ptychodera flava TaxID=63121 RepID=UPI003969D826